MGFTIILVSDIAYEKFLVPIVNSININSFKSVDKIHIHLVNYKNSLDLLSKIPLEFSFSNVELDDTYHPMIMKRGKKRYIPTQKKSYCANIRIKVILNLLKEKRDKLVYIDVDSLVRRDLGELDELFDKHDILVRFDSPLKIMSGLIGVKNTPETIGFFEEFDQNLKKTKYCTWGEDQTFFFTLYKKSEKDLNFFNVDLPYLDWDFNTDSIIWTAKGKRKEQLIYKKEETLYKHIHLK